jgi:aminoglycoside 6'-N-acetyltransferase I
MLIRPATPVDLPAWVALRAALWPDYSAESLRAQALDFFQHPTQFANFLAQTADGTLVGFAEASIRSYADGCDTSNVGHLEGWYVAEPFRQQGLGRRLVQAVEDWARAQGAKEMASDCYIDNTISREAHTRLGFQEVERLIHFRKPLAQG